MKAENLINQRFGRLVVLYKSNKKVAGRYLWHCKCDCGNETDVRPYDLKAGKTKSCGCLQKEKARENGKKTGPLVGKKSAKDITNQKFGKLLALYPTEERRKSSIIWMCKCDCGTLIQVALSDLTSGNTSSCGCLRSKGEMKIGQILTENHIPFEREKSFLSCNNYRFDFYVNQQYIIEYDGIQHYEENTFFSRTLAEIQENDKIKNQWCKDNNIPIIRIPYTHYKELELKDLLLDSSDFLIK